MLHILSSHVETKKLNIVIHKILTWYKEVVPNTHKRGLCKFSEQEDQFSKEFILYHCIAVGKKCGKCCDVIHDPPGLSFL